MPVPKPEKDENKQKFVSRCMSNETMKKDYPNSQQRVAICLGQTRKSKSSLIEDVHDNLLAANATWDDECDEWTWEVVAEMIYDEDGNALGSEYQGRKVQLNKPFLTPDGPKKRSVYVKNDKGNVVKVNFGDPNMKIKKAIQQEENLLELDIIVLIPDLNGKQDTGVVNSGNYHMSLIQGIQKALAEKINEIDNLKYKQNYDYLKTPSANIVFPELGDINLFNIVQKPSKNSSLETKKELDIVAKATTNRSIEDIKLVYLVDQDPLLLYEQFFEKLNLDFSYHKFHTIYNNIVSPLVDHLKNYYNRARPFQLAEYYNVKIDRLITKTHQTPSYPSGHTMYGALISELLIERYPAKKDIFEDLTKKTGHSRVLQGVHYPSDNQASIKIIKTIYPKLSEYYEKIRYFI